MPDPTVLGEGLLETDYPRSLQPADFRFDDIVAISPSEAHDQHDVSFPATIAGAHGTLVAIVTHPPRKRSFIDERARQGAEAPAHGNEVTLGTGTVRLRERTAGGRATSGERTAIGLDVPLAASAVQSLLGLWVRLELRS